MSDKKYSMSFTTASLLFQETLRVADLFAVKRDWPLVREQVLTNNLLQMRTTNSAERIFREISSRLKQLTPEQLDILLEREHREQNYLLWLAFCKRYRFVYDFAVEVVREKYLRLDLELTVADYEIYFNNKAEWHPEIERVAASTRYKQRQVLFKTMREADLLTNKNQIMPAVLSPLLTNVIQADNPAHLAIYPLR